MKYLVLKRLAILGVSLFNTIVYSIPFKHYAVNCFPLDIYHF